MAWITPIITWTPSPVGNADFNRIEGNTKYLREENKTINGTTTLTSLLTLSSSGLTSSSSSIDLLKPLIVRGGAPTNIASFYGGGDLRGSIFVKDSASFIQLYAYNDDSTIYQDVRIGGTTTSPTIQALATGRVVIDGTDNGTDLLQVGSDLDISVSMGRLKIDSRYSNYSVMSHYSRTGLLEYNIAMGSLGQLALNGANGTFVEIKIANANIATFSSDSIDMFADQDKVISMGKGKMGYTSVVDAFYIGHYDQFTSSAYGIRILSNSALALNSTEDVRIRNNDSNVATFGASSIDLLKTVNIVGTQGNINFEDNGRTLNFTRTGGSYIWANGLGGSLFFGVNGATLGAANASLWLAPSGNSIFGNGDTDNGTDLLQVGSDDDISVSMGRVRAYGSTGFGYISQYDENNTTDFSLRMGGNTLINAPSSGAVIVRNNGATTLAEFGASSIELKKDTTITGSLSVSEGYIETDRPIRNDYGTISGIELEEFNISEASLYTAVASLIEEVPQSAAVGINASGIIRNDATGKRYRIQRIAQGSTSIVFICIDEGATSTSTPTRHLELIKEAGGTDIYDIVLFI